ncbi:MAG: uroporphyrinogen decarboxylase [Bacteroidia bacterium]|nr:MAG: uroporphyrinogen decarboxylase [Bacteroidia bacterium]
MLANELLLKAAKGEITPKIPVWLMRQAGRVLPEYRAVRQKARDFINFVKSPELAAEVTIQPVDILNVDAAIIFSDILVIPEAMGLPYLMQEEKGPVFPDYIQSEKDIEKLHVATANDYHYVLDAIQLTKKHLQNRIPLIGFSGAPWTLFAYMTEGKGSKTFSKSKKWLYSNPEASHQLLQKITDSIIHYLKDQIKSGADIVQLFDSWAGVLNKELYDTFCIPYLKQICNAISEVPVIIFPKDGHFTLQSISSLNCNVVSLDWTIEPEIAIKTLPDKTLQGNADPCLLYADEKTIELHTFKMLKKFNSVPYIANLGHGLYPDIEKEKVKLFVEIVHSYTRSLK